MGVTRKTNPDTVCESGWNCLSRRRWLQGWFKGDFKSAEEEEDDDDEEEAEEKFDDDDDDVAML